MEDRAKVQLATQESALANIQRQMSEKDKGILSLQSKNKV
jgi:hypothetical protein